MVNPANPATLSFDGETVEPSVRLSSGYVKLEGLDYDLEDVWNNMLPVKSSSGKTTKKAKKTETENRKRNHASISCDDHIISGACEEEAEVEADPQVGRKDPVSVSFCGELVERVLYTNGFNKKVCVDNGDDGPHVALKAADVVLDVIQLSLLNVSGGTICVWLWKNETAKMKICLPSRGCLDIANDQQDIKDIMNMVATECLQNIFKVNGFSEDEMHIKDINVHFITGHVMLNRSIRINKPDTTWANVFSIYDKGSFTFDTAVNVKPPYNVIRVWFDKDGDGDGDGDRDRDRDRDRDMDNKNKYQYKINVNTGYIIILNTKCPSVLKRAAEGIINAIDNMRIAGNISISGAVRNSRVGKYASCGIKKGPGRPTKEQTKLLLQYNHNYNLLLNYNQK